LSRHSVCVRGETAGAENQSIGAEAAMQDVFFESRAGRPHFAGELLAPLHDLNHRFLDLVVSRAGDWRQPDGLRLPGEATARVAPLTAAQRAAAASCPYALFDLRFHDDEHWRSRFEMSDQWRVAEQLEQDTAVFVRLALFYAWHVAATTRLTARLLLGMTEHTAAAFRGLTLNGLVALAASESVNLTARWSESDVYWCALVGAAAHKDAARLRRIQLFGLQLAAASQLP
jgi:5-carboxymethyl-2-hydroxymuconate isomerase